MLVLSRKLGESVVISGNIRVTVVELRDGRCRLGIDAPADVRIDRQEVQARRQALTPQPPEPVR